MLSEIRAYIIEHGRVCMADLVNRFDAQPEALRGMLEMLIAKQRIALVQSEMNCGGCAKCDPELLEIYEWRGQRS